MIHVSAHPSFEKVVSHPFNEHQLLKIPNAYIYPYDSPGDDDDEEEEKIESPFASFDVLPPDQIVKPYDFQDASTAFQTLLSEMHWLPSCPIQHVRALMQSCYGSRRNPLLADKRVTLIGKFPIHPSLIARLIYVLGGHLVTNEPADLCFFADAHALSDTSYAKLEYVLHEHIPLFRLGFLGLCLWENQLIDQDASLQVKTTED